MIMCIQFSVCNDHTFKNSVIIRRNLVHLEQIVMLVVVTCNCIRSGPLCKQKQYVFVLVRNANIKQYVFVLVRCANKNNTYSFWSVMQT